MSYFIEVTKCLRPLSLNIGGRIPPCAHLHLLSKRVKNYGLAGGGAGASEPRAEQSEVRNLLNFTQGAGEINVSGNLEPAKGRGE